MPIIRWLLVLMALLAAGVARATSSMSFEASGHLLDFEIGDDAVPMIARVSYEVPGKAAVPLRALQLETKVFDVKARTLLLGYTNPGDPAMPPSFELSVDGPRGQLRLPQRMVEGRFNWDM